jgi:hypothetical protein
MRESRNDDGRAASGIARITRAGIIVVPARHRSIAEHRAKMTVSDEIDDAVQMQHFQRFVGRRWRARRKRRSGTERAVIGPPTTHGSIFENRTRLRFIDHHFRCTRKICDRDRQANSLLFHRTDKDG